MRLNSFKVISYSIVLLVCVIVYLMGILLLSLVSEKYIQSLLANLENTSHLLSGSIQQQVMLGRYREAWRVLKQASDRSHLQFFDLIDEAGNQLVEDMKSLQYKDLYAKGLPSGRPLSYYHIDKEKEVAYFKVRVGLKGVYKSKATVRFIYDISDQMSILKKVEFLIGFILIVSMLLLACFSFILSNWFARSMKSFDSLVRDTVEGKFLYTRSKPIHYLESFFLSRRNIIELLEKYKKAKLEIENRASVNATMATTQMIAHDIKKPFSLLKTGLKIIKSRKSFSEVKSMIKEVDSVVTTALGNVESILDDIMHLGEGRRLTLREHELEEILKESLQEVSSLLERERQINIHFNCKHLSKLKVDKASCIRVFSNLMHNAIQAMGPGGEIFIESEERVEDINIKLSNSHSQIPDEILHNIFSPFVTHGKKEGTGLGLAIVKKVIERHNGTVSVGNCPAQKRVVFEFNLPKALAKSSGGSLKTTRKISDFSLHV